MKKRLISLLLVFSMVFSLMPVYVPAAENETAVGEVSDRAVNPFTDVSSTDWYYDAVQYVFGNSLFYGTDDTTFSPDGTMTRGMFVTILGRMAGVDTSAYSGNSGFTDVPEPAYYSPYVKWAARYSITAGTGDGLFSPDAEINREQMAAFFVRYFEAFDVNYDTGANITSIPADLEAVSEWAKPSVLKLWQSGILQGDGGLVSPHDKATRAQAAALCRSIDNAVETWYSEPGAQSDRTEPDDGPVIGDTEDKTETSSDGSGKKPVGTGGSHGTSSGGNSGNKPENPDKPGEDPEKPPVDPDNPPVDPEKGTYAVSFYDGSRLIDTLYAQKDKPLSKVPAVEKSSKRDAILAGYFTDQACTQPFYAENPVTGDMKVYAKYEPLDNNIESVTEINITSFAQMNQSPDLSFKIKRVSGSVPLEEAAVLAVKDGSDPVSLSITGSESGAVVSAVDGFNEGCSYELTLADGWVFDGKAETIRTASFDIHMDEVKNLEMNDDIVYIEDTASIDYVVNGKTYDVLTSNEITEDGGTFDYNDAATLKKDDILCIYVGEKPEDRVDSETLDPAVYVKVKQISGNEVKFEPLGQEDQKKLYDIPDNFPITVSSLPTGETGTADIDDLDQDMYSLMVGSTEGTLAKAKEKIAEGDFVTLYTSQTDLAKGTEPYFGEITGYDSNSGEITYKKTTKQAIIDSMDLYSEIDIQGDDLITDDEIDVLERVLLSQVEESNFGEEAAYYLADMVTKTDGFRENMNVQDFLLTDENGNPLSEEEIELLNLGGTFELADDIKLRVELINKGPQLHFGGVQLAIGVDAKFEVEAAEGKVAIDLSATFIQEAYLKPTVRGDAVFKEILGIPVPIGVEVGANIDIKSFTAFSFDAEVYTVAPEDEGTWDKVKAILKDPKEVTGLTNLPAGLTKGLKTASDVINKIEELDSKRKKVKEDAEKYTQDIEALWGVIEQNDVTTREAWEEMGKTLGKTSIASDLMDLMNVSDLNDETELTSKYIESLQAMMDKYSEMLQKETDWITLVEKEIFTAEICTFGICVGVETKFVVRTDMSIAIGSNLEYEVGKRYTFWFRIGLFEPTAGTSSMDLIDEHFAFQFYVMGKLGVRAGIRAKVYVGIGTGKFASAGIAAELGPYLKLFGFFVYEYTKYRPANTNSWTYNEQMAGGLYLEFGLYFILGFEANAIGNLFECSYDFIDKEIPLLTAGNKRYYYASAYEPAEDETVVVRDVDNNSSNGITMRAPTAPFALSYVDLNTGTQGSEILGSREFIVTMSNPNFRFSGDTISVSVPDNVRYMECDMTITYRRNKLGLSQYDMTVTVPLVWTNLTDTELNEYFTASVRVGSTMGGGAYHTVWNKRVRKNQLFDLPKEDELKEIIGWNDVMYAQGSGYGGQKTEGLVIVEDRSYDYNIDYKTYTLTVEGVQNADGSTESRTFTASYGSTFDFSELESTGQSSGGEYKKFVGVSTTTIGNDGEPVDLRQPVNAGMAEALNKGMKAKAIYTDDSVTATFSFTGLDHADVEIKLRRGTEPSLAEIEAIAEDEGVTIQSYNPPMGKIDASTTFQVVCGGEIGKEAVISFNSNGAGDIDDIRKPVGAAAGTLPVPTRTGYAFLGWFTDNDTFENEFTANSTVPEGGVTLYANWKAGGYTITFNVNGGDALPEGERTKTVAYGEKYGVLPTPTASTATGYEFAGWYTDPTGGTQIKATDTVEITSDITLYARWAVLKDIPTSVFSLKTKTVTFNAEAQRPDYTFTAEAGATYRENEFVFKYMKQGDKDYLTDDKGNFIEPFNAGVYDLVIEREADSNYRKFSFTRGGAVRINKKTLGASDITAIQDKILKESGIALDADYTEGGTKIISSGTMSIKDGIIPGLSPDAKTVFSLTWTRQYGSGFTAPQPIVSENNGHVDGIYCGYEYRITSVEIDDINYKPISLSWSGSKDSNYPCQRINRPGPVGAKWRDSLWTDEGNYDISWYDEGTYAETAEYHISNAEELAGLAYLVNNKDNTVNFAGKTIFLDRDIDLSGHHWVPIGTNSKTTFFSGSIDGQDNTISNMYIDNMETMSVSGSSEKVKYDSSGFGLIGHWYIVEESADDAFIKGITLDETCYIAVSSSTALTGGILGCPGRAAGISHTYGISDCNSYVQMPYWKDATGSDRGQHEIVGKRTADGFYFKSETCDWVWKE